MAATSRELHGNCTNAISCEHMRPMHDMHVHSFGLTTCKLCCQ